MVDSLTCIFQGAMQGCQPENAYRMWANPSLCQSTTGYPAFVKAVPLTYCMGSQSVIDRELLENILARDVAENCMFKNLNRFGSKGFSSASGWMLVYVAPSELRILNSTRGIGHGLIGLMWVANPNADDGTNYKLKRVDAKLKPGELVQVTFDVTTPVYPQWVDAFIDAMVCARKFRHQPTATEQTSSVINWSWAHAPEEEGLPTAKRSAKHLACRSDTKRRRFANLARRSESVVIDLDGSETTVGTISCTAIDLD